MNVPSQTSSPSLLKRLSSIVLVLLYPIIAFREANEHAHYYKADDCDCVSPSEFIVYGALGILLLVGIALGCMNVLDMVDPGRWLVVGVCVLFYAIVGWLLLSRKQQADDTDAKHETYRREHLHRLS